MAVMLEYLNAYFRYILLLINALIQVYLMLYPIRQHIRELDEQVTFRIQRYRRATEIHEVSKALVGGAVADVFVRVAINALGNKI